MRMNLIQDYPLSCEDVDEEDELRSAETTGENHGEGLAKGAHRLSLLIASRFPRKWAQVLPRELTRAITTVRLAVMTIVNARPPK